MGAQTMRTNLHLVLAVLFALTSCVGAQKHAKDVENANAEGTNLTVGTVQKEIRVGMAGGEVASVLGAPNIVSSDAEGREVWIYDRISTTKIESRSSGGVLGLIFGFGGNVGGGGLGGYSASAGAQSTTQKTFTVVIKYDDQGFVRDFAYHTSTF
jgi:outer membrane protein assembly factor BamE (lipoprotein component of BamABCDE complex)